MQYPLNIPKAALEELQRQLAKHNEATGAQLELKPYLERVILEVAGMPALQTAIPALETARDEGYAASVKAAQAQILDGFSDQPS